MFHQVFGRSNLLGAGVVLIATWFVLLFTALGSFIVVTDSFKNIFQESVYNPDSVLFQIFVFSVLFGGLFYFSGTVVLSIFLTLTSQVKSKLHFLRKYLWIVLVFPFYTLRRLRAYLKTAKKNERIVPILASVFVFLVYVPIWLTAYLSVVAGVGYVAADAVGQAPVFEPIAGTGSMHPTFPKGRAATDKERADEVVATIKFNRYPGGFTLFGTHYFTHEFERGDIVTFSNSATDTITKEEYGYTSGFVKRVIALPGDTVELRGGIVYLNGKPLKEPYTASPRSTFAESFLSECKKITVPDHKLFVMGDNRKGSGDSREFGYVDFKDVTSVMPLSAQKNAWDKHWRDTSKDFEESAKTKINKEEYLALLNKKRKEAGVPLLKYQQKLEQTAVKRGEIMLKFDDLSFEASRSGYTMERAMSEVGYFNGLIGESSSPGYYTADELLENQFAFPETQKFLLEKDYDEIGIAEVEGEVNGCPTQILVQHYAGYVPPNYTQADIAGWQEALASLQTIQPGWAELQSSGEFYNQHKGDIDRINTLISARIGTVSTILRKMRANQWLTAADQRRVAQDVSMAKEIDALASKLNSL